MPAEHYRPKIGKQPGGYYSGYYCCRCGKPGVSAYGSRDHGTGICLLNPILVQKLHNANLVEAEQKRQFKRRLSDKSKIYRGRR